MKRAEVSSDEPARPVRARRCCVPSPSPTSSAFPRSFWQQGVPPSDPTKIAAKPPPPPPPTQYSNFSEGPSTTAESEPLRRRVGGPQRQQQQQQQQRQQPPGGGRVVRPAPRQNWLPDPSVRDARLSHPSAVEVSVFDAPYHDEEDLPSGFAERRAEEERVKLTAKFGGPLHGELPEGHPDRDDTGGSKKFWMSQQMTDLFEEDKRMTVTQRRWWAVCMAFGVACFAGMAAYATSYLDDIGVKKYGGGRSTGVAERSAAPMGPPPIGSAEATAAGTEAGGHMGNSITGLNGNPRGAQPAYRTSYGTADNSVLPTSAVAPSSYKPIPIPANLDEAFLEISIPFDASKGMEVPSFWHVPLTGGNAVEGVLGSCLRLVQASEVGCSAPEGEVSPCEDTTLRVVNVYGESYINVDTSKVSGIRRAVGLQLVPSHLADVIYSPLPHPASYLFIDPEQPNPSHPKGRMFAMFRHPADRAAASYRYVASSDDRPLDFPSSLEEYATSMFIENNLLTRLLVNKPRGGLTNADAVAAQEVLRRKCLVGLYDRIAESLTRHEQYFGLTSRGGEGCATNVLKGERDRFGLPKGYVSSEAYRLIMEQNRHDEVVYEYATQLYEFQGKEIFEER